MFEKNSIGLDNEYQFCGIDIIKFICAYLICFIHFGLFSSKTTGIENQINLFFSQYLCRIAVPFYFCCSGFLLFRKMELTNPNADRVKKYCLRILRLLGTWVMLLFVGGTAQLWYLSAVVVGVLLIYFLAKIGLKPTWIFLIASVLYIIGLLGDSYSGVLTVLNIPIINRIASAYEMIFETTRNGVFMGLIFILIGALVARKTPKISMRISLFGFLISMIAMFFEKKLVKEVFQSNSSNMFFCLIPATFFLLLFAIQIKVNNTELCKKLRSIGALIFYLQFFVGYFVLMLLEILNYKFNIDLSYYYTPILLIIVTVVSVIIEYLSHFNKLKFLRYLYS